ncbi:hypothetical protein PHSY_004074 [Pseudozyma hubeiensis SY62]|uniref:Uncharacterized protein n=1 Tax=Pseudozyma hubeiensis (strain SY62) TaxID=1305764 RepID=R9P5A3_PSEHS|nr:hypothetical protein PHSY_004074 [Pseudozyma hubeiensis SY62]GAC96494.1 hypothetical protein PHSY_004074 [Pseudozyma hubeiensis SY62]
MATPDSPDDGSKPINFRAALAAFQQNSSSSSSSNAIHSPKPRVAPPPTTRQPPPRTPARPSSSQDPVSRASSTPRIRNNSDNFMPPSPSTASSPILQPTTSASGMLSAPSPVFSTPFGLRKSGSGTSLNELMSKTLPRNISRTASPLNRSRSRSVTQQEAGSGNSAPASGRSSPFPPGRLRGLFDSEDVSQRTESPSSQHMLDTSAEDDMFAHAVMERSQTRSSTTDSNASLVPPQVPSRKGSASSTNSANSITPRLPPRPTTLAPSPTISEFGQLPPTTSKVKPKTGLVAYATYTPGGKRGSQGGLEGSMTPPALPPRSATLSQAERGHTGEAAYRARQSSPMKRAPPLVPQKPTAPVPPPRPAKTFDGAAGGFKFGTTAYEPTAAAASPRQNTSTRGTAHHQRSLTGGGSTSGSTTGTPASAHRKTGSNVFTSISLSDDASGELKRSLESDLHSDHSTQLPPPNRGRSITANNGAASRAAGPSPAAGGMGAGMVSSLIGTAASALPMFKSTGAASGTRSLADGAPSKQQYMSRSGSAGSGLTATGADGEASLWGVGRAVQLAEVGVVASKAVGGGMLKEPQDEKAMRRFEALFETLLRQQEEKRRTRGQLGRAKANNLKSEEVGERKASGGVQALRGWFESDPSSTTTTATAGSTTRPNHPAAQSNPPSRSTSLSPSTIRKIWSRSQLPFTYLSQLFDQCLQSQTEDVKGLEKQTFVRAMASIDAELERRKARRQTRQRRKDEARKSRDVNVSAARRVPPPPPPPSMAAV